MNLRQMAVWTSVVLLVVAARAAADEALPQGLKVSSVQVTPASVELAHPFDYRQLLITGKLESGEEVDLTRMAKLQASPSTVEVSSAGLVSPKVNGEEKLAFQFNEFRVEVPVKVSGLDVAPTASFVQHVMPAMSKMGCNSGTCHGAQDGKNGFKLSLRGYDPLYDHRGLTDDVAARRINRSAPDQSLMLLKATGSIPHVGGALTQVGSPHYEILRLWIAQGLKFDPELPRVTKIEVFPQDPVLPRANMRQQIAVLATYSDGKVRDVTRESFIKSGNIEVAEAEAGGIIKTLRRGEAPVLVRYEGAYAATTVTVMGDRSGFVWQAPPTNNYIDELVSKKLERMKILPSDLCTDEEFIRRVYLDLTGVPPTAEEVVAFLSETRPTKEKRDDLVDRLVGSEDYVEHWTNKWADLLQVNRKFLGQEGAVALRKWIRDAVAANKPYREFAFEVLTADGSNLQNPAAAYWKILREPQPAMENTTHLFLAVRFNCNKCHDHPFERWTQDQYYQMAAFFAQVGFKEDPNFAGKKIGGTAVDGAKPLVEVVFDAPTGEMKHERTGQVTPPKFPYQGDLVPVEGTRREQLAKWITANDNQYFARSFVNRQWGYLFGRGIIEPIDDIRAGNPPTNPELLAALTKDFLEHGTDVRHLHRTICKSRTYQLSVASNEWNADDAVNYSHAIARRLPAEVLFDTIHKATGSAPNLAGAPKGSRAATLPDAGVSDDFLEDFGRPVRESSCECERSDSMVLGPIMKLVNGPTVAQALVDPNSSLSKLAREEKDDAKLIDTLFLRFLARHATEKEIEECRIFLTSIEDETVALRAKVAELEKTLPERQTQWEKAAVGEVAWTELDSSEVKSAGGATFTKQDDKSILVTGTLVKDTYTFTAKTDVNNITGIRLEVLPDDSLPAKGPGRAQNGNFVLNEFTLVAAPTSDVAKSVNVALENAQADFDQANWHVTGAVDGNIASGWAVSPKFGERHVAVFETGANIGAEGETQLTFTLTHNFDPTHMIGRFRISVTNSAKPLQLKSTLPGNVVAILAKPAEQRSEADQAEMAKYYRTIDPQLAEPLKQLAQMEKLMPSQRLVGAQDLAWALINSSAFLFNR